MNECKIVQQTISVIAHFSPSEWGQSGTLLKQNIMVMQNENHIISQNMPAEIMPYDRLCSKEHISRSKFIYLQIGRISETFQKAPI